jgi:hypothetical protein
MWHVLWRREYRVLLGQPEGNDHLEDLGVDVGMGSGAFWVIMQRVEIMFILIQHKLTKCAIFLN